jgi:NADPH:quinone reductase-like Zn-dependent oxidoreductase
MKAGMLYKYFHYLSLKYFSSSFLSPSKMPSPKPTLILTGANGGLGLGFIQNLLASSYAKTHYAVYTVRNLKSADQLNKLLADKAPKNHQSEVVALDLSSLEEVRKVVSYPLGCYIFGLEYTNNFCYCSYCKISYIIVISY